MSQVVSLRLKQSDRLDLALSDFSAAVVAGSSSVGMAARFHHASATTFRLGLYGSNEVAVTGWGSVGFLRAELWSDALGAVVASKQVAAGSLGTAGTWATFPAVGTVDLAFTSAEMNFPTAGGGLETLRLMVTFWDGTQRIVLGGGLVQVIIASVAVGASAPTGQEFIRYGELATMIADALALASATVGQVVSVIDGVTAANAATFSGGKKGDQSIEPGVGVWVKESAAGSAGGWRLLASVDGLPVGT